MQSECHQLKVLIVEDDKIDAYQLERMLRRIDDTVEQITTVSLLDEALERCQTSHYDIVLVDLDLPDSGESETVASLRQTSPDLPIVVTTGRDHDQLGPHAIACGADDYLAKGQFDTRQLQRVIDYAIERRRTQRTLRDSEQRLRTILDTILTGVVLIDAQTRRIVEANSAAAETLGLDREQLVGSLCYEHLCNTESEPCPFFDQGGDQDTSERSWIDKDGRQILIWQNTRRIRYNNHEYLLKSFVDITERRQAEEALTQAKERAEISNRELEQLNQQLEAAIQRAEHLAHETQIRFLDHIHREIQTPIDAIKSSSEILLSQDLTPEQVESVRIILHSSEGILKLMNMTPDGFKLESTRGEIQRDD